ncbi:hypothetical protein KPH14_004309 [Odynerus spinipes]|uniref:Sulfite oxidase n=1 Tax=Odynerus spinipes TaxID=1348599 RepID=A0AAD9VVA0_9HYME|nr:hypothetical protein KPH14_004309 [Odynerus spinipes]
MILQSKFLYNIRQRSQILSSRLFVADHVSIYKHTFQQRERSQRNTEESHNYVNTKFATCFAIAASLLGICFYSLPQKKVHAISKIENVECGKLRKDLKTYTLEEVGKHYTKENRIWVTYKEGVYDITDFVEQHPGGPSKIMMAAGSAIEPFWSIYANHETPEICALLESMRIGNISKIDAKSNKSDLDDPYAKEPSRHRALKINGHKPFCAETPSSILIESFHTPANHLPVPEIDLNTYTVDIAIEDETKKTLDFEAIKKYPKYTITSAIMCGGNRRSEMAEVKSLKGLSWGVGAVGNATWSGARLCDVLKDLGINEEDYNHVQFEGRDVDPGGMPYGASIPISKAMDPRGDVLLAYEMNGKPIPEDHGFPIRVIVPGVVGARNVKWLDKIIVSKMESQSQWQQGDYKVFSPNVDWDSVDFSKAPAIQEMPVISAICEPEQCEKVKVKDGKINVKGYAWSGGGNKIIRVDVTSDQGNTWHTADLIEQDRDAKEGRYWSWTFWNINLPVDVKSKEVEIWAKAVDASHNVQPETVKNIWNLRGFLCNAYHKIKVQLD